ncbi:hypothetical protein ACFV4M_36410 [Kitasatospora indigofera]
MIRRLLDGWPAEEQRAFCALLARFNGSLESYAAGAESDPDGP